MAYYEDLTAYAYSDYSPGEAGSAALNIGWLDGAHPFRTGRASEFFVAALLTLLARDENNSNPMRGIHYCEFCDLEDANYPVANERGWGHLGSYELHIPGIAGTWFVAPSLVVHYVLAHDYSPPLVFQQAVVNEACAPGVPDRVRAGWLAALH